MTELLTIHEAAARLRKGERWLRDWLRDHPRDSANKPFCVRAGRH